MRHPTRRVSMGTAHCDTCGILFDKYASHQIYCSSCAEIHRKLAVAARHKAKYLKDKAEKEKAQ